MTGAITTESTADLELWCLYQWLCHDCPTVDGVPTAYGDAESLGIRMVAEYLRREEGSGDWADYVKADFSSAWLPEHRYSDEEQS